MNASLHDAATVTTATTDMRAFNMDAMLAPQHMLTMPEESNLALVAIIFLVCCVEVMLIKAVTELSPSSVSAYSDFIHDDPSVAYLTGQYERPYADDEDDDDLF